MQFLEFVGLFFVIMLISCGKINPVSVVNSNLGAEERAESDNITQVFLVSSTLLTAFEKAITSQTKILSDVHGVDFYKDCSVKKQQNIDSRNRKVWFSCNSTVGQKYGPKQYRLVSRRGTLQNAINARANKLNLYSKKCVISDMDIILQNTPEPVAVFEYRCPVNSKKLNLKLAQDYGKYGGVQRTEASYYDSLESTVETRITHLKLDEVGGIISGITVIRGPGLFDRQKAIIEYRM